MITYLFRRLFWLIPVLFTVSAVTFFIMHGAPGGPWDTDPDRRQVDAATEKSLAGCFAATWVPPIASAAAVFRISSLALQRAKPSGRVALATRYVWDSWRFSWLYS